ncbi:MAG TPA: hypothetical protein VNM69_00540 [Bacillus sp. (in: firmicutes)]|uniref:hypothetical protein n=1 Tax=Bacillus litorisediminis TaxID=2922713 RepID=UPI001FB01700|nr:hypothetical protein [Bacillus litorisediminis]HWO74383.1 hypothetical protein [Bacillus sp. (in: firmicutes)]
MSKKRLYELLNELDERSKNILYYDVDTDRLDVLEKNAEQIEQIAKEIQEKIRSIRR